MKKFLIFLAVCVSIAAIGFSIYYFTKDNEVIRLNYTTIPVNKGATIEAKGLLSVENPSKYTTIDYGSEDSGILEYDAKGGLFVAKAGGKTNIVIETKNNRYKKLTIEVVVRDGTEEFPYIIASEGDLLKVGTTSEFGLDKHYKVDTNTTAKEIALTARWIPVGTNTETGAQTEFSGVLDGNGHTISNVNISKYTDEEIKAVCIKVDTGTAAATDTVEYTDGTFDYIVNDINRGAVNAMKAYNNLLDTNKIKNAGFVYALNETGVVHDLTLSGVSISGEFDKAGSVAALSAGKIISVKVSGSGIESTKTDAYIGGIVGKNVGNPQSAVATIDRTSVAINLMQIGDQVVGGIAGRNEVGLVSESSFIGALTQEGATKVFGGIIGENVGTANALGTKVYYANARDSFALIYIVSTADDFETHDVSKIAGAIGTNVANALTSGNNIFGLHYALIFVTETEDPINNIIAGGFKTGIDTIKEESGPQPEDTAGNGGFNNASEMAEEVKYTSRSTRNGWNFEEVWQLNRNNSNLTYPALRKGAIGSNFDKDPNPSEPGGEDPDEPGPPVVLPEYKISTAKDLYDKLSDDAAGVYGPDEIYVITAHLDLSTVNEGNGWEVITQTFTGAIYGEVGDDKEPAKLTGLNIKKTVADVGVGMFKDANDGVFSNLIIDGVTITGVEDDEYLSRVGVLAGSAIATNVTSVEIKNVIISVKGNTYGTIFGNAVGGKIENVKVSNIDGTVGGDKLFDFAGGIVGRNGDVESQKAGALIDNVVVLDVKLVAYRFGGVAGQNYRQTISNADVSGMVIHEYKEGAATYGNPDYFLGVISQVAGLNFYNVFVGGVAGHNCGVDAKISNSSASSTIKLATGTSTIGREVYIIAGGIAGVNERGIIQSVYVYSTLIQTYNSYDARLGGVVGEHYGTLQDALVNDDVDIKSSTTYEKTGHRSVVGGVAGITWGDTLNLGTIRNAATYAKTITGFYAGGLVGISYGNIETSYVGSTDKVTTIKGFYAGGIAGAIIGNYNIKGTTVTAVYGGQVKAVYAHVDLVSELSKTDAAGQATVGEQDGVIFKNGIVWENIKNLNKGIAAGIAPFIMGEAKVSEGYTVATFSSGDNAGYRFQTTFSQCAGDLETRRYWTAGTMEKVIYVNNQSVKFETPIAGEPGVKKTSAQLKTNFDTFGWTASNWQAGGNGKYPEINKLNDILKLIAKAGTNSVLG